MSKYILNFIHLLPFSINIEINEDEHCELLKNINYQKYL